VSKGKQRFREAELSRLIRVAQKNNLREFTVRITADAVELKGHAAAEAPSDSQNEWDAA
jgi:hypothetical protein